MDRATVEALEGWALAAPWRGTPTIVVGTFLTRSEAIKDAERCYGRPWRKMYRQGYRVVKVRVEAV